MSSEAARRKRPEVANNEYYVGIGKKCALRFTEHSLLPPYSSNEDNDHPASV